MYVELGRGQDYAWSATSAAQDITDTYAVQLCQDDYALPPARHLHARWRSWSAPTPGRRRSPTPRAAGSYRMQVYRTEYGPVTYRATVGGKPVAYTQLRSSYMHEADSIIGFQDAQRPRLRARRRLVPEGGAGHQLHLQLVLRRLPADRLLQQRHQPGARRGRRRRASRCGPTGPYDWQGWDPTANTADYTPPVAASAVRRPGLLRRLEQQAGPRLHLGGLRQRLGAPRRPARRPGQGAGPGRRRHPGLARQGDGGRRADRPARRGRAARPAPGDQQRAGHRSPGGRRRPAVDRLGRGGRQAHGDRRRVRTRTRTPTRSGPWTRGGRC